MSAKPEVYQWKVDEGTVTLRITDHSSLYPELPTGYVHVLSDMPFHEVPVPVKIGDKYQMFAVFKHSVPSLYNMRTYNKWYRKDVLVTGTDREGNRVRVRMDRAGNLVEAVS